MQQPNLVTIQNIGGINGTNYIYVNMQGPAFGPFTILLTTPANPATTGAGSSLTYNQLGLAPGGQRRRLGIRGRHLRATWTATYS